MKTFQIAVIVALALTSGVGAQRVNVPDRFVDSGLTLRLGDDARQVVMSIEMDDLLLAAIDLRCPPQPSEGDPEPSAADIAASRLACVTRTVHNEFAQELKAVRLDRVEALESGIQALSKEDCAAMNALLKSRGKPALSQCGGG
jgi:hypothetical protein